MVDYFAAVSLPTLFISANYAVCLLVLLVVAAVACLLVSVAEADAVVVVAVALASLVELVVELLE